MHLKMTAGHVVNLNYGNYDKKTGLKGSLTKHFSLEILQKAPPKLGIHSSRHNNYLKAQD
jgi:hypothetical protein